MRSSKSMLFGCLVFATVAGCNGGDSSSSTGSAGGSATTDSAKKYTIAVIPKGQTHVYWKSVKEGAMTASDELKDVNIEWVGPQREDDREAQIKIVEDQVNKQVSGIVLAPLDATALAPAVNEAMKANIPVIVIDSGLKDGTNYVSMIATDNYKGGSMAADELSRLLNGKGKIVVLRYEEGSASTDAREKGFLDEIKKSPGIVVLSSEQHGGATQDTAQTASENLLSRYKKGDELALDGIYTPNESTTSGMLRTLEGMKAAGKVKFVGFDVSASLLKGLQDGEVNGLIVQNPRKMGYLGVKTIEAYLKGANKSPEKSVDTGATLLTKDKLTDPEIQKLIAPPKD